MENKKSMRWWILSLSPVVDGLPLSDTHEGVLTAPSPHSSLSAGLGVVVLHQEFVSTQMRISAGPQIEEHQIFAYLLTVLVRMNLRCGCGAGWMFFDCSFFFLNALLFISRGFFECVLAPLK